LSSAPFGSVTTENRLDVALFPGDNYDLSTTAGMAAFMEQVRQTVLFLDQRLGYDPNASDPSQQMLGIHQAINYWVILQPIHVTATDIGYAKSKCDFEIDAPSFADVSAVLHGVNCRDNSPNKDFSANSPSVAWHELHHAAFGLADEYCCDGGYWRPDPLPNIYNDQTDCNRDPLATNGCTLITKGFWRFEPGDCVMTDNVDEKPGDRRRVNWYFSQCLKGGC
jgi:hypothetical protein